VSISDNIAEGFGREHRKDKSIFYIIARGSTQELKNQHIYGNRVGYFSEHIYKQHTEKCDQIVHELNLLIKSLRGGREKGEGDGKG
jgi:four helix bundle protein